jgi:hypothetical protein
MAFKNALVSIAKSGAADLMGNEKEEQYTNLLGLSIHIKFGGSVSVLDL